MSVRATGELVTPLSVVADRVITVRVPASTSNLGAGFDSVGMAIGRWLKVTARVRPGDPAVVIRRAGTVAGLDCEYGDDLIWRGFVAACVALRRTPPDGIEADADPGAR